MARRRKALSSAVIMGRYLHAPVLVTPRRIGIWDFIRDGPCDSRGIISTAAGPADRLATRMEFGGGHPERGGVLGGTEHRALDIDSLLASRSVSSLPTVRAA